MDGTDRYNGQLPDWWRSCHGDCEAIGVVPVYCEEGDVMRGQPGHLSGPSETSSGLRKAWAVEHARPHAEPCSGWHFVTCAECKGTGRASWFATIGRIVRWWWVVGLIRDWRGVCAIQVGRLVVDVTRKPWPPSRRGVVVPHRGKYLVADQVWWCIGWASRQLTVDQHA